jgi:hypothetical protein
MKFPTGQKSYSSVSTPIKSVATVFQNLASGVKLLGVGSPSLQPSTYNQKNTSYQERLRQSYATLRNCARQLGRKRQMQDKSIFRCISLLAYLQRDSCTFSLYRQTAAS